MTAPKPPKKPRPWVWSDVKARSAEMVAAGEFSLFQIARQVGVSVRALYDWRGRAEFKARVAEHLEEYERALHEHMRQRARR
jgi:hypothetical protein